MVTARKDVIMGAAALGHQGKEIARFLGRSPTAISQVLLAAEKIHLGAVPK